MSGHHTTPPGSLLPFGYPEIAEGRRILTPDAYGSVVFADLAMWFFLHGDAVLNIAEAMLNHPAVDRDA